MALPMKLNKSTITVSSKNGNGATKTLPSIYPVKLGCGYVRTIGLKLTQVTFNCEQ